jgi:gliding motility-associated-like protein
VSPGKTVLAGEPTQLWANSSAAAIYQWSPAATLSNDKVPAPIAIPLEQTMYKVIATSRNGCITTDSVLIKVEEAQDIFVPNAFTPNGDGRNDRLIPIFPLSFTLKNFSIFNRWGQLVFSSSSRGEGWNGKLNGITQASGGYVWVLQASNATGVVIKKTGTLALVQ